MSLQREVLIHRVYDDAAPSGDPRILVDRLWPRGIAKRQLAHDRWLKDAAPSTELRKWYGHDPQRFEEFRRRYLVELEQEPAKAAVEELQQLATEGPLTLLTATRDVDHSAAHVLADYLRDAGP